mmetsp:Transcript_4384/g.9231  ORF Transcript_4384/g.9231 Transcript_4384/m.9231 type:complete len:425 (+) Transcript_4384:43-1317(+)
MMMEEEEEEEPYTPPITTTSSNSINKSNGHDCCWNFRPTALQRPAYAESLPRQQLFTLFHQDNARALKRFCGIPTKPNNNANEERILRTLQWNVHGFMPSSQFNNHDDVDKIEREQCNMIQAMLQANADVIVLNEYTWGGAEPPWRIYQQLEQQLQNHGYNHWLVGSVSCPTFLATRCQLTTQLGEERLSIERSALVASIQVPSREENEDDSTNEDRASSKTVIHIIGTHLDFCNGKQRFQEMQQLMNQFVRPLRKQHEQQQQQKKRDTEAAATTPNILILGDLNQQRQKDYDKEEWRRIAQSMDHRRAPRDDGVASLLHREGFGCAWDYPPPDRQQQQQQQPPPSMKRTNFWYGHNHDNESLLPPSCPPLPPSTHWSGTIVDYSYSSTNLSAVGCYVSPYVGLSDHRMTVCDWKIPRTKKLPH